MPTEEDITRMQQEDREAESRADRGGTKPRLHWAHAAIFSAVVVFILLDVFAAVTLPDRQTAFWPAVIMTALCAGAAGGTQRWRERTWWARYSEAQREIMTARIRAEQAEMHRNKEFDERVARRRLEHERRDPNRHSPP